MQGSFRNDVVEILRTAHNIGYLVLTQRTHGHASRPAIPVAFSADGKKIIRDIVNARQVGWISLLKFFFDLCKGGAPRPGIREASEVTDAAIPADGLTRTHPRTNVATAGAGIPLKERALFQFGRREDGTQPHPCPQFGAGDEAIPGFAPQASQNGSAF